VPADIEKGAQFAVAAANDNHALPGQFDGLEVSRVGKRIGATGASPHLPEQAGLLPRENLGIVEVAAG
jgi:hypothetical protein